MSHSPNAHFPGPRPRAPSGKLCPTRATVPDAALAQRPRRPIGSAVLGETSALLLVHRLRVFGCEAFLAWGLRVPCFNEPGLADAAKEVVRSCGRQQRASFATPSSEVQAFCLHGREREDLPRSLVEEEPRCLQQGSHPYAFLESRTL